MKNDWNSGLMKVGNEETAISNLGYAFLSKSYLKNGNRVKEDVKAILDYKLNLKMREIISLRKSELKDLFERKNGEPEVEGTRRKIYSFKTKTQYPGLVVGMSNPVMEGLKDYTKDKEQKKHEKEDKDASFKTGFTFDYVTGLPYIPGSSIKGMLRNSIIKYEEDIKEYVKENLGLAKEFNIEHLAEELFGDEQKYANSELRDVFLEAIVVKGDEEGLILKEDYITPHETPFSDPRPIHILALRPNVEMEFYFILRKEEIAGLSAETRFELYKELILELGIGAKTNTGYGNLVEVEAETEITQGEK